MTAATMLSQHPSPLITLPPTTYRPQALPAETSTPSKLQTSFARSPNSGRKHQKHPSRRLYISTPPSQHNALPNTPESTKLEPPRFMLRDLDHYPRGYTPLLNSEWETTRQARPSLPTTRPPRSRLSQSSSISSQSIKVDPLSHRSRHSNSLSRTISTMHRPASHDMHDSSDDFRPSMASATSSSLLGPAALSVRMDKDLPETPAHQNSWPKSSGNPLASLFGWRRPAHNASPISPPVSASGTSCPTSPSAVRSSASANAQLCPPNSSIRQATDKSARHSIEAFSALPLLAPEVIKHVDSLVAELRAVAAELAASIGREMELEDELDSCKVRAQTPSRRLSRVVEQARRTSDYYSDSNSSFSNAPAADAKSRMQGLEQMRRKAEQERAQMRIDMTQKVQEDLNERKALQMHIQALEEELRDHEHNSAEALGLKERTVQAMSLEYERCAHAAREGKDRLETSLSSIQEELRSCINERDNLRDEVVPQLHDRIEGLESEVAELQNLEYENTRLQQDVHWFRNENQTLVNARKLQLDKHHQQKRQGPQSGLWTPEASPEPPLRSSSLQRANTRTRAFDAQADIASTKGPEDALKEVEAQRDVLQQTLRSVLLRRDVETARQAKRIRLVEQERDRALSNIRLRPDDVAQLSYAHKNWDALANRADAALIQKEQLDQELSVLKAAVEENRNDVEVLQPLIAELEAPVAVPVLMASPSSVYDDRADVTPSCIRTDLGSLHGLGINTTCRVVEPKVHEPGMHVTTDDPTAMDIDRSARLGLRERQATGLCKIADFSAELESASSALMAALSASEAAMKMQLDNTGAMILNRQKHAGRLIRPPLALLCANVRRLPERHSPLDPSGCDVAGRQSGHKALLTRVQTLEEVVGRVRQGVDSMAGAMDEARVQRD